MKTPEVKSPASSAAGAAILFWGIYAVIFAMMLIAFWLNEPRLALTALIIVPVWLGALGLWGWRIDADDNAAWARMSKEERAAHGSSYYSTDTQESRFHESQKKRRLRRRRIVVTIYAVVIAVISLALFAVAIWRKDGESFAWTACILLAGIIPPFASTLED